MNETTSLTIGQINSYIEKMTEPKYRQAQVDLSVDVPEPVPVLKQGDYVIFSRGNISSKAKSRKTFLIVLFATDCLENGDGKILIVDTEMALAHTYKTARRIHRMMEWDTYRNNERLTVLSLREYAPTDRVAILREAIEQLRPELVFLDGVRDLVFDINDSREATENVGMLMRLSSELDCHICSILHENKGNGQLRGHLGTEIINKSETVMSVINNGDTSTVEPTYTRNMPFEAFTFRINDEGLPEYCDAPTKPAKVDKMRSVFETILANELTLSYSDLVSKVVEAEKVSNPTAKRRIKDANDAGIIIKDQSGGYYFPKPINDEGSIIF